MTRRNTRTKYDVKPRNVLLETENAKAARSLADEPDETFVKLGEFLRRASLGLAAMLFVARAYFPSEDAETGSGLIWVFTMLVASALAIASTLFSGTFRVRWSWADAAVIGLMVLVGVSSFYAADRRPAITMAWEWGALGLLYLLVRNLPRTRGESATLAGAVVATAVAVAAYGLYQIPVEFAEIRALYLKAPDMLMARLGIEPGTPAADALRNRLMESNEPFSTFALANSLAGFLVGPLALAFAVAFENLKRDGKGSRLVALALAAIPGLVMLTCLILTKSRSAQIGLMAAMLVLAWRARRIVPAKVLVFTGVGLAVLLGGLIAVGVATKQLDIQVITESPKSLRYRLEYWQGAWGVITDAPSLYTSAGLGNEVTGPEQGEAVERSGTFWYGVGPGNFATPYLRHKQPQASEEIKDPHNMVIEVWATAGVFAMLALLAAIGIGLWELLGPSRGGVDPDIDGAQKPVKGPQPHAGWLLGLAALGWILVWVLGKLNPVTQADLMMRWLILGLGWGLAVLLGAPLWRRLPIPAAGLGVAVLALSINLLAAGGIGMPSVAMSLWVLLALGLNLRDDRPCGRLRELGGLGPTIVLACFWAALAGTFYGAVMPFWESESYRLAGDSAMALRPPAYEDARKYYTKAIEADRFNVKPWVGLADLEYAYWKSPEQSKRKEPLFMKPLLALDDALDPTRRNPANLPLRRYQASLARKILREMPKDAKPLEVLALMKTIVTATRNAAKIYPTNATLRAELAQASADISMYTDAIREAKQALLLDGLTPHADKKLPKGMKPYLENQIPIWETKAKEPPPAPPKSGQAMPPGWPPAGRN
jgi:O-Antigen ligase